MAKRRTDKELLNSTLYLVILDLEVRLKRTPSRREILDELFSPDRSDPEARELERKLDPYLRMALEEWESWDEKS